MASGDISCSFTSTNGFALCISWIGYFIASITSYLAYFGAYFFSYAVQISLNSAAYSLDFISGGWQITRDVANMSFLFILIFIALTIMFKAETGDTIRTLAAVVVVALLVNFSFFFTRVVIDAGNILAVQFYNAIDVRDQADGIATIGSSNVKDLTAGIMNAVPVFSLFANESFQAWQKSGQAGFTNTLILAMLIFLSAAAMYILLAFTFLYIGIKFVLRIVGLWLVIVASPLAFVARTMESTSKYFEKWVNALIGFSIYPAAFLFIFLVMTKMAQTIAGNNFIGSIFGAVNMNTAPNDYTVIAGAIANIGVRMGFIIAMLYFGMKLADRLIDASSMDGGFAGWVSGKVSSWVPRAGFFATRAAGVATLGLPGHLVAQSNRLASGGPASQFAWRTGRWLSQRSYDARAVPGVRKGLGLAGVDVGTPGASWATRRAEDWKADKQKRDATESDRVAVIKSKQEKLAIKKATKDARRLAEIEQTWEEKRNELETMRTAKPILDASGKRKLEELEKLNTEREILSRRMEKLTNAQVTSLKASDVQGIVKQLSDDHLKAIKEGFKHSSKELEAITNKWHEENKKAPLGESKKQLEELAKIRTVLESKKVDVGQLVPKLEELTRANTENTITLKAAEDMKKEVEEAKGHQEDLRRNADTKAERIAAGERERELNKALNNLTKLVEKIKDIPEKVGKEEAPAAFKHQVKEDKPLVKKV